MKITSLLLFPFPVAAFLADYQEIIMRSISMILSLLIVALLSGRQAAEAQTILAQGEQPKINVDSRGVVRVVFGDHDKIFVTTSSDKGATFSKPALIAELPGMHLGMSRGPQLATSKDFSLVTAMDKEGNIYSYILSHKSGKWEKRGRVNDADKSAPEGLMSIAADDDNNFHAVWLDLRNDRKNNICYATLKNNTWSSNKFVYVSGEDQVCECCRPSVVARGKTVAIMFRNWLKGSRDLYFITSSDGGSNFSAAQKLGMGTWPLKGCPMDGGGLSIDSQNQIHTAWQREGVVYYSVPGQPEVRVGEGRHVSMRDRFIAWEHDNSLFLKEIAGAPKEIKGGKAIDLCVLSNKSTLAVWEKNGEVLFEKQ